MFHNEVIVKSNFNNCIIRYTKTELENHIPAYKENTQSINRWHIMHYMLLVFK